MKKADVLAWIRRTRVVPVVRADSPNEALSVVAALLEGGLDVFEITMTIPGAIEVMREVAARHGPRALVGAGTVLDADTAEKCAQAGARFIISPAFDLATVHVCKAMDLVAAPGALTPTEILQAWRAGADVVKVFPCDAMGGATYVKSLKAPLSFVSLLPTGGVTLSTVPEFLKAGADAVGVGSNLVDLQLLRDGRRGELVRLARQFRAAAAGQPA